MKTISLSSALPAITDTIVINGYSQTGASANTLATGNDAVLNIVLNGSALGAGANGITLAAGLMKYCDWMVIGGFNQYGLSLNSSNNVIAGNFIGTNASGTAGNGNGHGVYISDVSGNTIGGTTTASRNVISGNPLGYLSGEPPELGIAFKELHRHQLFGWGYCEHELWRLDYR